MPEWVTVLGVIIGTLGGLSGIAAFGTLVLGWRKAKPDIARLYEEMSVKQAHQITDLRTEVDHQGKTIRRLRATMRDWLTGIRELIQQIIDLDADPVWVPGDCDQLLEDDDASR